MISSYHRPTRAEIFLPHIAFNFQQVMRHIPQKDVRAFAVVKANAYGHGAVAVAKSLRGLAHGFAVSNVDEALELRQAGVTEPILVLGVAPVECIPLAVKESISLTVASLEWLEMAMQRNIDMTDLAIHIKVDSGMGRIGFRHETTVRQAIALLAQEGAVFQGIFTHFATADEQDTSQFERQLAFFKRVLSELEALPDYVHASNSATSIWHSETVFNAVRLGDVLYGLNPSGHELDMPYEIKPALQLTSELVHIKQVESGATVGYGATYTATETEWIGTVPIGYADGLTRSMQGFSFLVDGQECPIVGRVSMDQITLRLPKSYEIGTPVLLIGTSGEKRISVQDWADVRQTINYEIVCLLSDRIPRIFYGEQ